MEETNNAVLPRKAKTIIKKYNSYYKTGANLSLKINLIDEIKKRNKETTKELYYEFENQYEILILGIKTNISINEYCSKLFKESHDSHSLIVLSSNITTQLLSIKTCLENGALISVKALFRVLIEAIHLFQACLTDEELNTRFSQMTRYDNNKYYFKNLSRGQLFNKCLITYKHLRLEIKKIKYLETRNKKLNSFLSESIHSSYNAVYANYKSAGLNFLPSDNIYGNISIGYPNILALLIEQLTIHNTIFKYYLEKNNLTNLELQEFKNYEYHANLFDELSSLFIDDFFKIANEFSEISKELHRASLLHLKEENKD